MHLEADAVGSEQLSEHRRVVVAKVLEIEPL